jgi:restriction system protein
MIRAAQRSCEFLSTFARGSTSSFTKDGIEFAKRLQHKKIVLIDGERLTQLMIDHNIGVSTATNYAIKKIDFDYFDIE